MENSISLSTSNAKIKIKINPKPKIKNAYLTRINKKLFQPISHLNIKQNSLKQIKKLNISNDVSNKILNTSPKVENQTDILNKRDITPNKKRISHHTINCKTPNKSLKKRNNSLSINNIIGNVYYNYNNNINNFQFRKFKFEKIRNKTPVNLTSKSMNDGLNSFQQNNYVNDGKYLYINNDQMKIINSLKKELKHKNEENIKLKNDLNYLSRDILYTKYNEIKIENDIINQEVNKVKGILKNKNIEFINKKDIDLMKEKQEAFDMNKELIQQQKNTIDNLNKINEQLKGDLKKKENKQNNNDEKINLLNNEIEKLKKIIETNELNQNSLNEKINQLEEENKNFKNKENDFNDLKNENNELKNKIEELKNNNKENLLNEENIKLKKEIEKLKLIEEENKSLNQKLNDIQNLKNENEKINMELIQNKFNNDLIKIESGLNEIKIEGIKIDNQLISDRKEIKNFEKCLVEDFIINNNDKKNNDINNIQINEKKENETLISEKKSKKDFEINDDKNKELNKDKIGNTIIKNNNDLIEENDGDDYFKSENNDENYELNLKNDIKENQIENDKNNKIEIANELEEEINNKKFELSERENEINKEENKSLNFFSENQDDKNNNISDHNEEEEEDRLKLIHDTALSFVNEVFNNVLEKDKMEV